ncbi:MAG: glutamate 5-kinase [bacterium]|nr:glutamate 5-kinase [bacterium]
MRITIKVGTSTLTHATGHMNIRHVEALCRVISDLKNAGHEIILVSSGAIGMGVGKLSLREKPTDMPTKQAAAAVGQCELMYIYDQQFSRYHHNVGQILITGEDLRDPTRHENFRHTLLRMLALDVLPIINENDTVATDEIAVGDNDTLGALVAVSADADVLVILSDINGLYTADPRQHPDARLIEVVDEITPDILALAGGAGSALGTGGMATKLSAAGICVAHGTDMVIANGNEPELLYGLMDHKPFGTRFIGRKQA